MCTCYAIVRCENRKRVTAVLSEGCYVPLHETTINVHIDTYEFPTLRRCPKGVKKTLFDHCAHVMFAFYGDYMRWDGLVERLVYYGDDKYKDLVECHDFYQRRKDMLKKRIYYIKEMKVIY